MNNHGHILNSFYSTYEELKLTSFFLVHNLFICFYSTYEELKPLFKHIIPILLARFLQYLWGIETTLLNLIQ